MLSDKKKKIEEEEKRKIEQENMYKHQKNKQLHDLIHLFFRRLI